ncbi:recombinase XerC, partial [Campylobacter helveticus]
DELDYFKEYLKESNYIMQTHNGKLLNRSNAFIIINRIYAKANNEMLRKALGNLG